MYHPPGSPREFRKPNKGLRREAFRSHFLLFILDTIMMTGLLTCGVIGVIYMDQEKFSTPPYYVASFVAATVIMAKATVGGCFSVFGLYVKEKPEEPETGLVILHMVISVVTFVGFFISIVVLGTSRVLEGCASSNDTPGCSPDAQVLRILGAVTLVLILLSIGLSAFGVYLFMRFGKEFDVSPYKKSPKKKKEAPRASSKPLSINNDMDNGLNDF